MRIWAKPCEYATGQRTSQVDNVKSSATMKPIPSDDSEAHASGLFEQHAVWLRKSTALGDLRSYLVGGPPLCATARQHARR